MDFDIKNIPFIAISILIAIVILYVGVVSFSAIGEDYYYNSTFSVVNETWNASAAGEDLSGTYLLTTTVTITNATGGENISSGAGLNYTLAQNTPNMVFNTSSEYIGHDVNVTYQYNNATRGTPWAVTENATKAASNMSQKFPLMATVIMLAIILGIIFTGLYFQRK